MIDTLLGINMKKFGTSKVFIAAFHTVMLFIQLCVSVTVIITMISTWQKNDFFTTAFASSFIVVPLLLLVIHALGLVSVIFKIKRIIGTISLVASALYLIVGVIVVAVTAVIYIINLFSSDTSLASGWEYFAFIIVAVVFLLLLLIPTVWAVLSLILWFKVESQDIPS